jgi:hypothetical protein
MSSTAEQTKKIMEIDRPRVRIPSAATVTELNANLGQVSSSASHSYVVSTDLSDRAWISTEGSA